MFRHVESCVGSSRLSCWFRMGEGVPGPGVGRRLLSSLAETHGGVLAPAPGVLVAASRVLGPASEPSVHWLEAELSAQYCSVVSGDRPALLSRSGRQSSQEADLECSVGQALWQHQPVSLAPVRSSVPLSGCAQARWSPPVAAALQEVECRRAGGTASVLQAQRHAFCGLVSATFYLGTAPGSRSWDGRLPSRWEAFAQCVAPLNPKQDPDPTVH